VIPILDRLLATMISRQMRGVEFTRRVFRRVHSLREIEHVNKYGVRLLLREDYIDNIIIRDGYYESEVLEAMVSNSPRDSVVWDVGANFGLHAVTLKVLRPDLKIICFEPSPLQSARILVHARMNKVSLEVIGVGLGETTGYADLHVNESGNPGMTTFTPWSEATYDLILLAAIDSGDRLLETTRLTPPSLIKVDVEGGEIAALSGLKKLLRQDAWINVLKSKTTHVIGSFFPAFENNGCTRAKRANLSCFIQLCGPRMVRPKR
jgi:FkbM family methyltransferase